MNKVYYVMINGRTLESRDIKELLARAVCEKRNSGRRFRSQARSYSHSSFENASPAYVSARSASML